MKMLRQPTWDRLLSELRANSEIRSLLRKPATPGARRWRVGVVGCGRVARRHLYGYLRSGRTELSAVFDPSDKARAKLQKRFGIPNGYANLEEFFRLSNLDVVSVCSPPRFHAEAVIAAAKAGVKAVLCEKPLGLDLAEADRMIAACAASGTLLATGHQRRFGAQHKAAKELLRQKEIGHTRLLVVECPRDILRAGIHAADMVLDYLGPVTKISASLATKNGGPAKDPQQAALTSEAGDKHSLIYLETAAQVPVVMKVENRSGLDARLRFLGDNGELEIWWDGGLRYRRNSDAGWTVPDLELNPYLLEFQHSQEALLDAVEGKSPLSVSGQDGRNSLEVILAILEANQRGQTVTLPLETPAARSVAVA